MPPVIVTMILLLIRNAAVIIRDSLHGASFNLIGCCYLLANCCYLLLLPAAAKVLIDSLRLLLTKP